MAAFLAALSQLHVQPGIACSTCSLSSGAPARPSIDIVDEASEATARGLEVDQLRPACVAAGANAGVDSMSRSRVCRVCHDVIPVGS